MTTAGPKPRRFRLSLGANSAYPFPPPCFGVPPVLCFEKGEVATASFGFTFFGFFTSRLLRFWPFAMT
jgi:hypothetical protein